MPQIHYIRFFALNNDIMIAAKNEVFLNWFLESVYSCTYIAQIKLNFSIFKYIFVS